MNHNDAILTLLSHGYEILFLCMHIKCMELIYKRGVACMSVHSVSLPLSAQLAPLKCASHTL